MDYPERKLFEADFAARFGREAPKTAMLDGRFLKDLSAEELHAAIIRLLEERDALRHDQRQRSRIL